MTSEIGSATSRRGRVVRLDGSYWVPDATERLVLLWPNRCGKSRYARLLAVRARRLFAMRS